MVANRGPRTGLCPSVHSVWAAWLGGVKSRAPEILLGQNTYTEAVDMWAVGCIFGELLRMPVVPEVVAWKPAGAPNRLLMPISASALSGTVGWHGGRAPEILLGQDTYTEAVDMWAVGCIFGELLRHEPLFPAKGEIETLELMTRLLGRPSDRIWPVRAAPWQIEFSQVF